MPAKDNKGPFGLSDEQFWNNPMRQKTTGEFGDSLMGNDVDGIFIDMPGKVMLETHQTVPLVGFQSGSTEKVFKFNFKTTVQVIVIHLESGKISLTKPVASPAKAGPKPSPGWTIRELEIDLGKIIDLSPKLGHYSVWLVNGSDASNTRQFRIFPNSPGGSSTEFLARTADLRMEGGSPYPLVPNGVFDLRQNPTSAPMDPGPIWNLKFDTSIAFHPRLELEYQIEARPRFVFPKSDSHLDETGNRVYANLPIMILGFDENRSIVIFEKIGLSVISKPGGTPENPTLGGRASFAIQSFMKGKSIPKRLSVWAVTLDHRCMAEIKASE